MIDTNKKKRGRPRKEEGTTTGVEPTEEISDVQALREELETLKKEHTEDQEKLKMLVEVADRGRVLNYESQRVGKKPMKVNLSVFQGGFITGWRTLKDVLVKNPTTGLTVGEEQQYEVLVLDKEGNTQTITVNSYPAFTDARYAERVEVEVVGKREDWSGSVTFDLLLPDGRTLPLDSRFVN